jgi:thiol-disulfide isomerase/thioredoxin
MTASEADREQRLADGAIETAKLPRLLTGVVVTAVIAASVWVLSGATLPFQPAPPPPPATKVAVVRFNLPDDALGTAMGRQGAPAPDFEWESPGGSRHRLSELRGRAVVVNVWATWCAPCRAEMPALQRVAQTEPDTTFIELNLQEDQDQVATFFERLELRNLLPIIDPNGETIYRRYGLAAPPTTYFIGSDGIIRLVTIGGPMDEAAIRGGIARARTPAP